VAPVASVAKINLPITKNGYPRTPVFSRTALLFLG